MTNGATAAKAKDKPIDEIDKCSITRKSLSGLVSTAYFNFGIGFEAGAQSMKNAVIIPFMMIFITSCSSGEDDKDGSRKIPHGIDGEPVWVSVYSQTCRTTGIKVNVLKHVQQSGFKLAFETSSPITEHARQARKNILQSSYGTHPDWSVSSESNVKTNTYCDKDGIWIVDTAYHVTYPNPLSINYTTQLLGGSAPIGESVASIINTYNTTYKRAGDPEIPPCSNHVCKPVSIGGTNGGKPNDGKIDVMDWKKEKKQMDAIRAELDKVSAPLIEIEDSGGGDNQSQGATDKAANGERR